MILFQVYIKYVLAVVECVYNCKRWDCAGTDIEMYLHSGESHHACTCHLLSIEQSWCTIGTGSAALDCSRYQRGWRRVNSLCIQLCMVTACCIPAASVDI